MKFLSHALRSKKPGTGTQFTKLFPHPLPESPALECLYIAELVVAQDFIFPQIFGHNVSIDMITPWLIILFVFRAPSRVLLVATVAAFLLETHSAIPRGMYFCLYWMLGVFTFAIRHHISWKSPLPWLSVLGLGQVFVVILENLTFWTQNFVLPVLWYESLFKIILHILLSCCFGIFLVMNSSLATLEEYNLAKR